MQIDFNKMESDESKQNEEEKACPFIGEHRENRSFHRNSADAHKDLKAIGQHLLDHDVNS